MRLTKAELETRMRTMIEVLSSQEGLELLKKLSLDSSHLAEGKRLLSDWRGADLNRNHMGEVSQEHTQRIRKLFRHLNLEMTLLDMDLKDYSPKIRTAFRLNPKYRRLVDAEGKVTRKVVRNKQGIKDRLFLFEMRIFNLMSFIKEGHLELVDWGPARIASLVSRYLEITRLMMKASVKRGDLAFSRDGSRAAQRAARAWQGRMSRRIRQSLLLWLPPPEAEEWLYRLALKPRM